MKKIIYFSLIVAGVIFFNAGFSLASVEDDLAVASWPYVKYFRDRAVTSGDFSGLTRSFQIYLGGHTSADQAIINYGAVSYDQSILARIGIASGDYSTLDAYIRAFGRLNDVNNPLINTNGNYRDGANQPLKNGLYRIARILGREIPNWWNTWDWIVDSGSTACWVVDALDAHRKTANASYRSFAILLGEYLLRLQDTDGGLRFGPRGMYHYPEGAGDFYWNMKSTEQNERALFAFEALFSATGDARFRQSADRIKVWLKSMYDKSVHLYKSASIYNGSIWVPRDFGYVATDVMALAPLEMMFSDSFFGATQAERDAEVDSMFAAIELRTMIPDGEGKPKLFKFSVSQTGEYGTVEWSAQMALAYLKAAQNYNARGSTQKAIDYLAKYRALVTNLEYYFFTPDDDSASRVAPYASYSDGRVAGGLPTGTGYNTFNCKASLASAYYSFAKAGYDPSLPGGGQGLPVVGTTINLNVPWYENNVYSSTGAATAQMVINFMRQGPGVALVSQSDVYQYAKSPEPAGAELNPLEIRKVVGHFDPYDALVSNWADSYDSRPDGNPFQGYSFSVDVYDPLSDPEAQQKYLRDICHWMAFTVTKEDWWRDGELVANPNTPAIVPLYGSYGFWVVVKGFVASANPCPEPRTNPFNTPDFTVYGLWIKDPRINGIGQDTYKTAAECLSNYFLPVVSADFFNGKYIQIAEPPLRPSSARAQVLRPKEDIANFEFMGVEAPQVLKLRAAALKSVAKQALPVLKKSSWQDIVDKRLLNDPQAVEAFSNTQKGKPILVKRIYSSGKDYYLLPFGRKSKGRFLAKGVVVLDAADGHFKEASWTNKEERFLKVDKAEALSLVRTYLVKRYYADLQRVFRYPPVIRERLKYALIQRYRALFAGLSRASIDFVWEPGNLSVSIYRPLLKVDLGSTAYYVTQEGKVSLAPEGLMKQ